MLGTRNNVHMTDFSEINIFLRFLFIIWDFLRNPHPCRSRVILTVSVLPMFFNEWIICHKALQALELLKGQLGTGYVSWRKKFSYYIKQRVEMLILVQLLLLLEIPFLVSRKSFRMLLYATNTSVNIGVIILHSLIKSCRLTFLRNDLCFEVDSL